MATLRDCIRALKKVNSMPVVVKPVCPGCKGSGLIKAFGMQRICKWCNGTGVIEEEEEMKDEIICPNCMGSGKRRREDIPPEYRYVKMGGEMKLCKDCKHRFIGKNDNPLCGATIKVPDYEYGGYRTLRSGFPCQETREDSTLCGHEAMYFEKKKTGPPPEWMLKAGKEIESHIIKMMPGQSLTPRTVMELAQIIEKHAPKEEW